MSDARQDSDRPLVEHLVELRSRLLRALLAVVLVFVVLIPFSRDIYAWLSSPLRAYLDVGMIATSITSPLLAPLKLIFFCALVIAIPYVLHQTWAFVAPGLYRRETRVLVPILISSVLLFYAGIAFSYLVVFPIVFAFFTGVAPEGVAMMTDINLYLSFVLKLFFAFGLAFEIPIAILLLVRTGVASVAGLQRKRPYIVLGCFVVGMLLTPPDVISQSLLAVPMWLLFELGLLLARLGTPKLGDASAGLNPEEPPTER